MKKLVFIAAALSLFGIAAHADPITVAQTLAIRKKAVSSSFTERAEWNALTLYLQGVIEGAVAQQKMLAKKGHVPLFCPPKNKSYSLKELFRFLEQSKSSQETRPAVTAIMEGYMKAYPCRK